MAGVNHPKVSKAFGQVVPGNTDMIRLRFYKEAIVPGSELDCPDFAREQALDSPSLIITESITSVGHRAPLI